MSLWSCGKTTPLRELFKKQTLYEAYVQSLSNANLDRTALGKDWIQAGQRALHDSTLIKVPFQESAYFSAEKPTAYGFRFQAYKGQKITIQLTSQSIEPVQVFMDLFEWNGMPEPYLSADSSATSLSFEIEDDRLYLLRIQPELLRSGRYTLTITDAPILSFPVQGKDSRSVGSFWGADRDGGIRKHEGIDIFAPRGTPVVASANGTIRGVSTTNLGGKVVWLRDKERGHSLYYAHLDQQLVQDGQEVQIGDTLGLLGNTGNAVTTAPHLHFGLYSWPTGAIDPYPYVKASSGPPAKIAVSLENLGTWYRVATSKSALYATPDRLGISIQELPRHCPLRVIGGASQWYHVELPTGQRGYIASKQVEPAQKPIQRIKSKTEVSITELPEPQAAVMTTVSKGESVAVLATFGPYWLVQTPEWGTGWMSKI